MPWARMAMPWADTRARACRLLWPQRKASYIKYLKEEVFGRHWIGPAIRGAIFDLPPYARKSPLAVTNNSTEAMWKTTGQTGFENILPK